jgi:hypothetical protein
MLFLRTDLKELQYFRKLYVLKKLWKPKEILPIHLELLYICHISLKKSVFQYSLISLLLKGI